LSSLRCDRPNVPFKKGVGPSKKKDGRPKNREQGQEPAPTESHTHGVTHHGASNHSERGIDFNLKREHKQTPRRRAMTDTVSVRPKRGNDGRKGILYGMMKASHEGFRTARRRGEDNDRNLSNKSRSLSSASRMRALPWTSLYRPIGRVRCSSLRR